MVTKSLLSVFLLLSCVYYATAAIDKNDVAALTSTWGKISKDPTRHARLVTVAIVDKVVVPIASDVLDLVSFILDSESRKTILSLIPHVKKVIEIPEFKIVIEAAAKIITKNIIPKIDKLVDIFNNKEAFVKQHLKMLVEIYFTLYNSALEKARPVVKDLMAAEFTKAEISAMDKVLMDFESIDYDMFKRIIKSVF